MDSSAENTPISPEKEADVIPTSSSPSKNEPSTPNTLSPNIGNGSELVQEEACDVNLEQDEVELEATPQLAYVENQNGVSLENTMNNQAEISSVDPTDPSHESVMEVDVDTVPPAEIIPSERTFFSNSSLVELARYSWTSDKEKQMYTRGCLWSPDGTCVLMATNLDGMHVFELATDLYSKDEIASDRPLNHLRSAVHVKEGGTVYDFCWYPFMNSGVPETCCWLASRQHEPIHMWDAFNGELRCSYRGYDEVDEVTPAISVTFSNDGQLVIGGFKKSIKIFDTNVPGRDCTTIKTQQATSCFALNPTNPDVITAGSWNGIINMYDQRMPKFGCLSTLVGHTGGITHMKYGDSTILYSGARKDNNLFQWDMRDFSEPVRRLQRNVATNQRIYFDLSPQGEWLASGDTDGIVKVWDVANDFEKCFNFPLHGDCCNGVSFHPSKPILATSAGQYHFLDNCLVEDQVEPHKVTYENSLIFWWCGKLEE